jgi:hypothetical protein
MSVKLRKYQGGDDWEVDIRVQLPDGTVVRERKKAPVTGRICGGLKHESD